MEDSPKAINDLVTDLHDTDEFVRSQAAFALGLLGRPAVPHLIPLLRHGQRDIRLRAAWTLGVIGSPAVPELVKLLDEPSRQVRIEVIRILGVIGEARALNHLFQALTDFDPEIAARAARSLGKIGDPRAFYPLVTALRHREPDVRYEAARALALLHLQDSVPALEEALESESEETSWGVPVADAFARALQDLARPQERSLQEEFAQLNELLRYLEKHKRPSRTADEANKEAP